MNKGLQNILYVESNKQYKEKISSVCARAAALFRYEESGKGKRLILHHQTAVASILRLQPLSWFVDRKSFDDKIRAEFDVHQEDERKVSLALQMACYRECAIRHIQKYVHLTIGADCHQNVGHGNRQKLLNQLDEW